MPANNRRFVLYTLAIISFSHIVDSMLIMPLGDIFIKEFNLTSSQYGLLVSVYSFAAAVSSVLAFFKMDEFDRKTALLFIYAGFTIGTILCAFAPSYEILVLLRMVTGFFGGVIGALALAIVSDLYVFEERGRAMGVLMAAFSAAAALGIPIGLYLAEQGSWQTPFVIIGIMSAIIWLIVLFSFPKLTTHLETLDKNRSPIRTIKNTFGDANQVWALVAGFVLVFGHFLAIPFISPYMINNVGLSQTDISIQFFAGGLATVFTAPIIGKLTDKYGYNKVFLIIMLICFIPIYMITNLEESPLWYAVVITTLFFIFASGRMIPANTIITSAPATNTRGSFMSIKSALQQLAIGLSATVSAMIVYQPAEGVPFINYNVVGYMSMFFGLVTIWLLRKIRVSDH